MIKVSDITKVYQMGAVQVHALRGVSLQIKKGEFVAIMGSSGSGKSTLMHILGLLDVPDSGHYQINGQEVRGLSEDARAGLRAREIGFIFQQFNLLARISARDNVALPLIYGNAPGDKTPDQLLERVGLGDRKSHAPNELSGGQQQRVAIARALVNNPPVIMADEPTGNLDSESAADILQVLQDLHRSGLTVIMVTHDPEVAAAAERIITMKDGQVLSDTKGTERTAACRKGNVESRRDGSSSLRRKPFREFAALLAQASRSLSANKVRTALSMLGVLIGVAAVIAVMALGAGAKVAVEAQISAMGANLLVVQPPRPKSRGVSLGAGIVSRLSASDAGVIQDSIEGVQYACGSVNGNVQVTFDGNNCSTEARGVELAYETIHSMTPQTGRFFSEEECSSRARVAVIGTTVYEALFDGQDPVGQTIRINRNTFEVVGLLPDKGSSASEDENDQVLIPLSTAMRRVFGEDYVREIEIQVESADYIDSVETAVVDLMNERHRVTDPENNGYETRNMAELQSTMAATSNTLAMLLTSVGGISLLVGGIGIMNIMLVSVTERTREIGIRKAIGARRSDILMQFLVEAVAVSLCGGALGIALGGGFCLGMRQLAGWAVAVQPITLVVALTFSVFIGVVFGLWPARQASLLQPIEALRYE
ncbi:MAG: ABC transporter permease [Kiritimatiellales bacterium]|nr:ABC transporter permease [Kiritimatiellales bacterium]